MISSVDILSRGPGAASARRRVPAWLLPAAIAAGFLLIFLALFRDRLLPARHVEVAVVLATPAAASTTTTPAAAAPADGGAMIFQASGWIEPDPFPVKASALVDGTVETLHVLEGQEVEKGAPLATLVEADARLALKKAEQEHQRLAAAHAAHLAAIATVRKKLVSARSAVESARASEEEARDVHERVNAMRDGAISRGDVTAARLRLARDQARTATAAADADEVEADIARMELETAVKTGEMDIARTAVETAALAMERTRILAPISGRVLRILAGPGQKRMLGMDDADSSGIAILYDPASLQVRVDVPLADAAGLHPGQRVRVHCAMLQDRVFQGEVLRVSGEADLQRNTLQAKVRILDPVPELRPEMLCRAEFLSAGKDAAAGPGDRGGSLATWVPASAVAGGAVWIVDPATRRVSPRQVESPGENRDGYTSVDGGSIRPGEWAVIAPEGLRDGQRVNFKIVEP